MGTIEQLCNLLRERAYNDTGATNPHLHGWKIEINPVVVRVFAPTLEARPDRQAAFEDAERLRDEILALGFRQRFTDSVGAEWAEHDVEGPTTSYRGLVRMGILAAQE